MIKRLLASGRSEQETCQDRILLIRTVLQVTFKHILINPTSFLDTPISMRILHNTSFLTSRLRWSSG
jgi:hypothetical protein